MKLITEMFDNFEVLTEGKNGKDLKIKGVFMQAETKNRNGRMYPLNILTKEVTRYNKDPSWRSEVDNFINSIINNQQVITGTSDDALQTMKLVYKIYYADSSWREKYDIKNPDNY